MDYYTYKTNIQFCDVNLKNELSLKGIIRILGEAASNHSNLAGYGLNDMEKTNISWVVLNWKVKLYKKPKWNSALTIHTWPRTFSKVYSNRDFEIYYENELIGLATSKWVSINYQTLSLTKITPELITAFDCNNSTSVFDTEVNDKEDSPLDSKKVCEYKINKHELDTNHHVNNVYYIDFAIDALPDNIDFDDFYEIEILYKKQILGDSKINMFYYLDETNNQNIITIKNEDSSIVHSIIKLK